MDFSLRSTPNADIRIGIRAEEAFAIAGLIETHSRLHCGSACALNLNCMSYSFCGNRFCTLNNVSAHHWFFGDVTVNDSNCLLASMKREDKPACAEKGEQVDIIHDVITKCAINRKRIDAQWTGWSEVDGVSRRNCDESQRAHGGRACESSGVEMMDRKKVLLEEAQANCEREGARLFDDVSDRDTAAVIGEYIGQQQYFWINVRRVQDGEWYRNGGQGPQIHEGIQWVTNTYMQVTYDNLALIMTSPGQLRSP